ncbi:MAG: hypothetical protein WC928_00090 [Patescibacteria group bacterium]|jgi:hypothetical protein
MKRLVLLLGGTFVLVSAFLIFYYLRFGYIPEVKILGLYLDPENASKILPLKIKIPFFSSRIWDLLFMPVLSVFWILSYVFIKDDEKDEKKSFYFSLVFGILIVCFLKSQLGLADSFLFLLLTAIGTGLVIGVFLDYYMGLSIGLGSALALNLVFVSVIPAFWSIIILIIYLILYYLAYLLIYALWNKIC